MVDTSESRSRLVMIDDQQSYAEALGLALSMTKDLELSARAPDGPTGIELCRALRPDAILCDYRLPGGDNGTDVLLAMRESGLTMPAIVLTGFLAPQVEREVRKIRDCVSMSKDSPIGDIVSMVRRLVAGEVQPDERTRSVSSSTTLTEGELEVLELLNAGQTPAEVAQQLFLSLHTVRGRIKSLHRKLGVSNQLEAVATATRLGLLVPPS